MASIVELAKEQCKYDKSDSISHEEETRLTLMITQNCPHVKIKRIERLNNKYLYASFMLKKSEKNNYLVKELIHSTAAHNISSIEKENLDWRRVHRAKYGYGVSFSANADYADFHSSITYSSEKAFIICDVLVANTELTNNCVEAPSGDIDTHQSSNEYVYVKFDDFTFYPKYALYYDKPDRTVSRFYVKYRRFF